MTKGSLWLPQDPVTPTSSEPPAKPSHLDDGDFGSFLYAGNGIVVEGGKDDDDDDVSLAIQPDIKPSDKPHLRVPASNNPHGSSVSPLDPRTKSKIYNPKSILNTAAANAAANDNDDFSKKVAVNAKNSTRFIEKQIKELEALQFSPKLAMQYLIKEGELAKIKAKSAKALNFPLHDSLYGSCPASIPSNRQTFKENVSPSSLIDGRPRAKKVVDQKHLDMLEHDRPKREDLLPLEIIDGIHEPRASFFDPVNLTVLAPVDDYRKYLKNVRDINPINISLDISIKTAILATSLMVNMVKGANMTDIRLYNHIRSSLIDPSIYYGISDKAKSKETILAWGEDGDFTKLVESWKHDYNWRFTDIAKPGHISLEENPSTPFLHLVKLCLRDVLCSKFIPIDFMMDVALTLGNPDLVKDVLKVSKCEAECWEKATVLVPTRNLMINATPSNPLPFMIFDLPVPSVPSSNPAETIRTLPLFDYIDLVWGTTRPEKKTELLTLIKETKVSASSSAAPGHSSFSLWLLTLMILALLLQ